MLSVHEKIAAFAPGACAGFGLLRRCAAWFECLLLGLLELEISGSMVGSKDIEIPMTPAGLEPAIPGSVGRCLIHWATGPDDACVSSDS